MFQGSRLKQLRIKKGLTQSELGEIIGLNKSTICCYEKGTRQPPIENILDFIQIFNVSADYLLGSDYLVKTFENDDIYEAIAFTREEIIFIEELRKDKTVCEVLLEDPYRGAKMVKNRFR